MTASLAGCKACVFDAYGTLFDVHSPTARESAALGERAEAVSNLWRQKQLEYTWLRSLMRRHADFWQVTGDGLDFALATHGVSDPALRERLMQLYLTLDAYGDVADALPAAFELRRQLLRTRSAETRLPLARIAVGGVTDLRQRNANDRHILAKTAGRNRPRAVVEQITAGFDLRQILVPGLRVELHHQIDAAAPSQPALFADAHFIPGGKALNVGRENIARTDRHAHAQNALGEQFVGRSRTRAVDVGELDDEVVDRADGLAHVVTSAVLGRLSPLLRQAGPACVVCNKNFCMSEAPVGQRSAHKPQCRQTSSSLAMMWPVLKVPEMYRSCS